MAVGRPPDMSEWVPLTVEPDMLQWKFVEVHVAVHRPLHLAPPSLASTPTCSEEDNC